jgi:hypothetical protein
MYMVTNTKSPKRPRDPNQPAKLVVDSAVGDSQDAYDSDRDLMLVLTRIGDLKGGPRRPINCYPDNVPK